MNEETDDDDPSIVLMRLLEAVRLTISVSENDCKATLRSVLDKWYFVEGARRGGIFTEEENPLAYKLIDAVDKGLEDWERSANEAN